MWQKLCRKSRPSGQDIHMKGGGGEVRDYEDSVGGEWGSVRWGVTDVEVHKYKRRIKRRQKRQFRFRDTHISQILAQDCYFELLLLDSNDSYPLFNILSARSHSNNWLFNSRHRKTWNDGRKKSERKFGKKKSWIKFNFSRYINSIYEITLGKSGGFLVLPIFSFCHFEMSCVPRRVRGSQTWLYEISKPCHLPHNTSITPTKRIEWTLRMSEKRETRGEQRFWVG